MTGQLAHKQC